MSVQVPRGAPGSGYDGQEREFERLGGSRTIHTHARLTTATDLCRRLNVFPIRVPPCTSHNIKWILAIWTKARGSQAAFEETARAHIRLNRSTVQFRMKKLGIERPALGD
jgi:hypothetical protein